MKQNRSPQSTINPIASILVTVVAGVIIVTALKLLRSRARSPRYRIVCSDGNFELRDYPFLTVVETGMREGGAPGGFNRLFRFISGANYFQKRIAMTTPVFMSGSSQDDTMAFIMPEGVDPSRVPEPIDSELTVRRLPAGRFAVLRFSGERGVGSEEETLDRLREWVEVQGLTSTSTPIFAYYDPPWKEPFLRRNEVMVRVDE